MSNAPFEIKPEVLAAVYYSERLTLIAGMKYSEKFPSFESIGITLEPNPGFVVTMNDPSGFNFLVSVIEPLRKRYKFGMWSPGKAITKNKVVFSYFTHNSKEYINEFLELLGCNDSNFINKFSGEFAKPQTCKEEQIFFANIKEDCRTENILRAMNDSESSSTKIENLFENFIILSKNSPDFKKTITEFAARCIIRKLFTHLTPLIKSGLDISQSADGYPPFLTLLGEHVTEKDAIDLVQFSLRFYVNENNREGATLLINFCSSHNISVDEPGKPSGKTALHWASIKDQGELRELLISAGADSSKKDTSGKSPDMYFEDHKGCSLGLK